MGASTDRRLSRGHYEPHAEREAASYVCFLSLPIVPALKPGNGKVRRKNRLLTQRGHIEGESGGGGAGAAGTVRCKGDENFIPIDYEKVLRPVLH